MLCFHHVSRRRCGISDIGKHLTNMHRQPHLWARRCIIRPSRFRRLVADRQGRLDRPLGHLVKRQRQPKSDNVQ
jgi:hypothetical protein